LPAQRATGNATPTRFSELEQRATKRQRYSKNWNNGQRNANAFLNFGTTGKAKPTRF